MQARPVPIAFAGILFAVAAVVLQPPDEAIAQSTAFRGAWATGIGTPADIDLLIARLVEGNYNAVLPHVWQLQEASSGVYWHSNILPRASAASGEFDPLAYLVQQAHANGLEVHAWIVPYRACRNWPPAGNTILTSHPEWVMTTQASMGGGPSKLDGTYYCLDPGSPDVQEYLLSVIRELVTNYAIDGIHWDLIRYTQADAGYPADADYARSGLARFQQIGGYAGTPTPTDASWNDFRRREVSELVRRARAEIAAIASNPRQPLRHSAALITWGDAPSDFAASSAYASVFQDWRSWMEHGWLDTGCPMIYRGEYLSTESQWYRDWVDAAVGWRYQRQMCIGQALYRNTMADSVTQMHYAYTQGADGTVNFRYARTVDADHDGTAENDPSWYPYVAANIFTEPVATPAMPWRDPATATEGTLWGRVIDGSTGDPVDDAEVTAAGVTPVRTDGNGCYVATMIPAAAAGTAYEVTVDHRGYVAISDQATVLAGDIARLDLAFGPALAPVISQIVPDPDTATVGESYHRSVSLDQGTADSWTLIAGPVGASISPLGQVGGWTPTTAVAGRTFAFVVRATNSVGSDEVSWQVLVEEPRHCRLFTLTGFEGYANGATVMFQRPRYAGQTDGDLEVTPDIATVTDAISAFGGDSCLKLEWQWVDANPERWLRLTTWQGPHIPNPTIWLDSRVRVRLRVDSGRFRLAVGIREIAADPDVGDDGGTTGPIEWVGATSVLDGAPQGILVEPMPGVWQTFIVDPAVDPITGFTGDGVLASATGKGTFEELAFSVIDSVGPFVVYIDDVQLLCPYPPTGDFDQDDDVDLSDFGTFQACFNGPNRSPIYPSCSMTDFDFDGDVDLADFAIFSACFNGPNRQPANNAACS